MSKYVKFTYQRTVAEIEAFDHGVSVAVYGYDPSGNQIEIYYVPDGARAHWGGTSIELTLAQFLDGTTPTA